MEGDRISIPSGVLLRSDLKPGDLGSIVRLHGILYAREYGFDLTFEGYVAAGVAELAPSFTAGRDRVWVLEKDGEMTGSIAIVHRPPNEAQLRWFLVHPELRGQGLGRALLKEALRFSLEQGYRRVFLWTLKGLAAATHLYESHGFEKTAEKIHPLWGKTVHEERYDLELKGLLQEERPKA